MEPSAQSVLAAWGGFYIITGSVAGALIGLQFVVIALIADSSRRATSPEIAAFGTPTVLHFCAALLVAALLSAPWTSLVAVHLVLVACGLAGVAYCGVVIQRARRTEAYRPELEDWIWHAVLPLIAYVGFIVAAAFLTTHVEPWLAVIAAATLGLVFIGIHNAWDTVVYIATGQRSSGGDATGSGDGQGS